MQSPQTHVPMEAKQVEADGEATCPKEMAGRRSTVQSKLKSRFAIAALIFVKQ